MLTVSLLIALAIKSLVLAALTLGLLRLSRKRTAAERSLIAHLGLLALVLLPLASLSLPAWAPLPQSSLALSDPVAAVPLKPSDLPGTEGRPIASNTVQAPAPFAPNPADLALWLYAIPLTLIFAMMVIAVLRLFGMRRRAEVLVDGAWLAALAQAQRRMGFKHGTALLVSDELRSPISWGVLRPTILLDPRAVSAASDAEAIIAHELAHVARLDWAKLLIARLACALFWFNPLVWILARESHHVREEAADDTVLLTNISGADYANLLVNAARHDNQAVLIAAHGVAPAKNSLRRRVMRVLDADAQREPLNTGWGMLCFTVMVGAAAPLAAFSTIASPMAVPIAQTAVKSPLVTNAPAISEPVALLNGESIALAPEAHPPLSPNDLVSMRAVGATPNDVAEMRNERGRIDAGDIIAAKATGVTAEYIADMRRVFPGIPVSELVGARAVGVDAAYAQAMRTTFADADLDTIIGARALGVSASYTREMRSYFPNVTLDDLVGMRAIGVSGKYIGEMRASGIPLASPDEAVSMRAGTGRRGPPPALPRGPRALPANGTTTMIGPNGTVTIHREEDGTTTTAIVNQSRPRPSSDD